MSGLVGNLIGSLIQSATVLFCVKLALLYDKEKKLLTIKDIFFLIFLFIPISLIYSGNYNAISPIIFFTVIIFCLFFIYKFSLLTSFLFSGIFMVILVLSDLIVSLIFVGFLSIQTIRTEFFYIILTNLLVGLIEVGIFYIKWFRNKIVDIILETEKHKSLELITFIILLIFALSISIYILFENYYLNRTFIVGILGMLIFLMLSIIFLKEKYDKNKIISKYDHLFEYIQTFEEWMDNESINIHESKNQLASIREMVKSNKKAVNYIDNIIQNKINLESKNVRKLKNIPKGGLKGLLYYKIILAETSNITLFLDISDEVKSRFYKLNMEENKLLCRLIGIFFDNAIESAKDSEKKMISCEIYTNNENIIIIITNTYKGKIELDKINKNGYSTKGKNRGKGLYLANKIVKNSNVFFLENRIINDFYIQKITIKKR